MLRAALRVAGLVVTVTGGLTACNGATSTQPTASASLTTPISAVDALARLFVTALPDSFVQQADLVGDTGPSDLAKASRDDGKPDATTVLTHDGFVAGYQRLWRRPSDRSAIIIYIYQFGNPIGATNYQQRDIAVLNTAPAGVATHQFGVNGISGATGVAGSANGMPAVGIVFTKGGYLVQVAMQGAGANPQLATVMAQKQLSRLP